jgi:hypothetical protein
MRTFLAVIMLAAIALPAFAGDNPNVVGYIDFDPPNRVHSIMPAPGIIRAYVCFGDLDMGLTGAAFMLTDVIVECPGVFLFANFTNLLPGNLAIGDYRTGLSLASTECMPGPDVCVGYLEMYYSVGACCVELLDHPDPGSARWVTDCNDPAQVDLYTLIAHGSIGGAICEEVSPVEDATWGSIKALYR